MGTEGFLLNLVRWQNITVMNPREHMENLHFTKREKQFLRELNALIQSGADEHLIVHPLSVRERQATYDGVRQFEDLFAWQKARQLVFKVYQATTNGSISKDYRFCGQIQSA